MEGKIYQAMSNVYGKIGAIGKDQRNEQQRFNFRGIDDVYNSLHKIFAEEGIFVIPEKQSSSRESIESKSGGKGFITISTIKFNFYASDGSCVSSIVDGEGADYGDKSTSKSQSMAIKYALLQIFMVPTEDTIDGDKTSVEEIMAIESGFMKDISAIKESKTLDDLRSAYIDVYKKYEDKKEFASRVIAAKDEKKKELEE